MTNGPEPLWTAYKDGTPLELIQEAKHRIDECTDVYYLACWHLHESIEKLIKLNNYDVDFDKAVDALECRERFSEFLDKTDKDLSIISKVIDDLEICINNIEKGQRKDQDFFLETNEQ